MNVINKIMKEPLKSCQKLSLLLFCSGSLESCRECKKSLTAEAGRGLSRGYCCSSTTTREVLKEKPAMQKKPRKQETMWKKFSLICPGIWEITQGFFQLTSDPICFSSTHGILMSLGYTAFTLGKANKGQKGTYFQSKAIQRHFLFLF